MAHIKWGGNWRIPTIDEIEELCKKCSWYFTTRNQVKGMVVTGPNGNSIFLPAASYRDGLSIDYIDFDSYYSKSYYSYYLSSNLRYESYVRCLELELRYSYNSWTGTEDYNDYWLSRALGYLVRPVCE